MKARPGRPRLAPDDPSVNVHFRIPSKVYDETQKAADLVRLTHSEWLRAVVTRAAQITTKAPR